MATNPKTLEHQQKTFKNLKLMLKEFELAYNLGPKMKKKQVSKLWQHFQTVFEEHLKELLELERLTIDRV